mmetsp:Transcript_39539/g.60385  ORF Transcript_39539/g.60385 Transcript_39539/m.60385 type:complete len:122 (+) Transcript_39539:440-805(+)
MPGEHLIGGRAADVEFHLSHKFTAKNVNSMIRKVDISIFFSVNEFDRSVSVEENATLSDFFDDMNLMGYDHSNLGIETLLPLSDLMTTMDFDDRWIYQGSSTAPPCARLVYRSLVRRVYPI